MEVQRVILLSLVADRPLPCLPAPPPRDLEQIGEVQWPTCCQASGRLRPQFPEARSRPSRAGSKKAAKRAHRDWRSRLSSSSKISVWMTSASPARTFWTLSKTPIATPARSFQRDGLHGHVLGSGTNPAVTNLPGRFCRRPSFLTLPGSFLSPRQDARLFFAVDSV